MIYSSSRIRKLYVEENDYVREGEPLFTVEDSKDALINMESSKANLDQKKAELNSSESKLLSAKSLRDFYKSQYKRYQFLANSGAATLEQAQQQLTLYRAAEQDYLSNLEQVKANKAALASARWVYRSNKFKSDISTVRAPADVRVFKVYARTGEGVRDGKPVMDVGESQNMGILAEVYRIDINKIRLNQKASITVNGMPMIRWAGKVIQISTQATQQSINSDDPATAMANRVFNVLIKLSPVSSSEAKNFNYMEVNVVFDR
jgi:HlyD family secretion protein